jgi:hypothetical protein
MNLEQNSAEAKTGIITTIIPVLIGFLWSPVVRGLGPAFKLSLFCTFDPAKADSASSVFDNIV